MTKQHYDILIQKSKVLLLRNYCFTESLKLIQTVREYIHFYKNQTPFILFLVFLLEIFELYNKQYTTKSYLEVKFW